MNETKTCSKCGEVKPLDEYDKGRRQCKMCRKEYRKKHLVENYDRLIERKRELCRESFHRHKEKRVAEHKAWVNRNKEHHLDYHKRYNQEHSDHYKELGRQYYLANKEKRNAQSREYQRTHKNEIRKNQREHDRERLKADPNYRLAVALRGRIRAALKRENAIKCERSSMLLGCSIEFARKHIEAQFEDGMSWANHGDWHIDHIKPCASFDLTDAEQQKRCFHYTNLQPLWAIDNLKKSDRVA